MLESFLWVKRSCLLFVATLLPLPPRRRQMCVYRWKYKNTKRTEADGYMLEECVASYDKKKTHQVIVILLAEMKKGENNIFILPKSWSTYFCE